MGKLFETMRPNRGQSPGSPPTPSDASLVLRKDAPHQPPSAPTPANAVDAMPAVPVGSSARAPFADDDQVPFIEVPESRPDSKQQPRVAPAVAPPPPDAPAIKTRFQASGWPRPGTVLAPADLLPLLDSATELGEHRQILAHVDALLGPRSSGSVLLVPRAATADAATLTASLGAVAAAEFRRPVLLIDAARQQGGLATLFGLLEAPGWEELVAGLEPGQVIQSSGWAGVDVIPGGRRLAKTSARLWAEKTPDLLRRFAEDYRWLFLHGPAVTAGPWWLLLAGAVDGLCFVAADQQQAQLEHEALAAMACQTGRLLGNIVLA